MNTFNEDVMRGKAGEYVALNIIANDGYDTEYLADDDYWRQRDCDFCQLVDGVTYEVKTDGRVGDTHNLLLEDYKTHLDGTKVQGWLWASQADVFVFVSEQHPECVYFIMSDALRDLVRDNPIPHRTIQDHDSATSTVYLVPMERYLPFFDVYWIGHGGWLTQAQKEAIRNGCEQGE